MLIGCAGSGDGLGAGLRARHRGRGHGGGVQAGGAGPEVDRWWRGLGGGRAGAFPRLLSSAGPWAVSGKAAPVSERTTALRYRSPWGS